MCGEFSDSVPRAAAQGTEQQQSPWGLNIYGSSVRQAAAKADKLPAAQRSAGRVGREGLVGEGWTGRGGVGEGWQGGGCGWTGRVGWGAGQ